MTPPTFAEATIATTGAPLYDPTEPNALHWWPANQATAVLTAAVEASRDLRTQIEGRDWDRLRTRPRERKLLVPAALSLGDTVERLRMEVETLLPTLFFKSRLDPRVPTLGRELRRALHGPLRRIRNERAAHHDSRELKTPECTLELVLSVLRPALCLWQNLTGMRGVYGWNRPAENGVDMLLMGDYPPGHLEHADLRAHASA